MKKVFILMTVVIALFGMVSCDTTPKDPFADPVDATPEETGRILDIYMTAMGVFDPEDESNYDVVISDDGTAKSYEMKDGVALTNEEKGAVVTELLVEKGSGFQRRSAKVKLDDGVHTIMVYAETETEWIVNLDGKAYRIEVLE